MSFEEKTVAALLVAAGVGTRAGGGVPKQFRTIGSKAVIAHAVDALVHHHAIDTIMIVVGEGQEERAAAAIGRRDIGRRDIAYAQGAESRQGSVRAGLEAIASAGGADYVLIHDAARPFVPGIVIDRLLDALTMAEGAIPTLPVADTLVRGAGGTMGDGVDREALYRVQTPQAFRFDSILEAHRAWNDMQDATDDAQILKASGHDVALVQGDDDLDKLTYPQDFLRAEARFASNRQVRVGMGYDVHRLADDEELWLGGVLIPHDRGLAGHSDADVALHAIVDAMLGALAEGDIGSHFPPSDPQWRGASSDRFLAYARDRVSVRDAAIDHVDLTIICEAPKIGPHREAIRSRIAEILQISLDRVSVKATTTERLGFAGRREGIAAQAVATLSLPALF